MQASGEDKSQAALHSWKDMAICGVGGPSACALILLVNE